MSLRTVLVAGTIVCSAWGGVLIAAPEPPAQVEGAAQSEAPAKPIWVSGYYAGWFWNDYPPSAVDMTTMTHFIFGRYAPGGGTLGGRAGHLVHGAGTGHRPEIEDALIRKAHAAGVKALAMIGGAWDGGGFVASTAPGVRAAFIDRILDRCVAKNYDGVDVDWEDSLSTGTQRGRLIAFLTELRAAAARRARYRAPNAPFVITFPGYAVNVNTDLPVPAWKVAVAARVDQYNLMTYGMQYKCCGWSTWLWAALTGEGRRHPTSIASSIQAYVDAGVPRHKLGMGLGLYGRMYGPPVTGPRQSISGYFGAIDSVHNWRDFHAQGLLSSGTYRFDALARAGYYTYSPPISYRGRKVSMLTTEDPQSIAAKGAWARAGNCGGTIVWTINYGYTPGNGRNLPMEAVRQAFLGGGGASN
jgi:GH18 family chitinase